MRNWTILSAVALAMCESSAPAAPPAKNPGREAVPAKVAARPQPSAKPHPTGTQALDLGSITARVPGGWTPVKSDSQFRLAQYAVPKAPGTTATALFIVYYFGKGGGGTVEANMERWIGMVRQPNGSETRAVAKRGQAERPGLRISTLDVAGTYMESPTPMSTEVTPRPNYRMLAAIIETTKPEGEGPYYFRLVGPARSIAAAKAGWEALLGSVRAK
jgi:hypothetical protein